MQEWQLILNKHLDSKCFEFAKQEGNCVIDSFSCGKFNHLSQVFAALRCILLIRLVIDPQCQPKLWRLEQFSYAAFTFPRSETVQQTIRILKSISIDRVVHSVDFPHFVKKYIFGRHGRKNELGVKGNSRRRCNNWVWWWTQWIWNKLPGKLQDISRLPNYGKLWFKPKYVRKLFKVVIKTRKNNTSSIFVRNSKFMWEKQLFQRKTRITMAFYGKFENCYNEKWIRCR